MKFIVQPCGCTMHPPADTAFTETGVADGGE
jgi:hypothetical protein